MQILINRDSKPWLLQVWISFLVAVFLCAVGLSWLPGRDLDRAFMVMGYFFCLSAAFVLAKYVRDQEKSKAEGKLAHTSTNTPMFKLVVWGGFFLAMSLTGWGLWRMEINETYKAFLGVSWLYLITCSFTLAKTLRDRHEADLNEARLGARAARGATEIE
ncbi:YiaA/YiaB family inner membrane protein [Polaromonas sp.]|uniref:YiaA/YiaB family inner membrane protein n=1 Tax=Polaromonas sp. TaxID=1869339 RepID=UPI003BAC300F